MNLFLSFLLTFTTELVVYLIFFNKEKGRLNVISYCFLINLFTWPLANFFYSLYPNFIVIEFAVFIIEGVLIRELFEINWKRALIISFISNLITALLSFL